MPTGSGASYSTTHALSTPTSRSVVRTCTASTLPFHLLCRRLANPSLPTKAQWHQWLRQTRSDPPSIREQQADIARQARLKHLALQADERWASKPSLLDKPTVQPGLETIPRDPGGYAGQSEPKEKEGVRNAVETPGGTGPEKGTKGDNPWKRQRGGPSEEFQPEAWSPGAVRR